MLKRTFILAITASLLCGSMVLSTEIVNTQNGLESLEWEMRRLGLSDKDLQQRLEFAATMQQMSKLSDAEMLDLIRNSPAYVESYVESEETGKKRFGQDGHGIRRGDDEVIDKSMDSSIGFYGRKA